MDTIVASMAIMNMELITEAMTSARPGFHFFADGGVMIRPSAIRETHDFLLMFIRVVKASRWCLVRNRWSSRILQPPHGIVLPRKLRQHSAGRNVVPLQPSV